MTEIEQLQDDLVDEVLAHLEEWLFEKLKLSRLVQNTLL